MGCRLWGRTESDTTEAAAAAADFLNLLILLQESLGYFCAFECPYILPSLAFCHYLTKTCHIIFAVLLDSNFSIQINTIYWMSKETF